MEQDSPGEQPHSDEQPQMRFAVYRDVSEAPARPVGISQQIKAPEHQRADCDERKYPKSPRSPSRRAQQPGKGDLDAGDSEEQPPR